MNKPDKDPRDYAAQYLGTPVILNCEMVANCPDKVIGYMLDPTKRVINGQRIPICFDCKESVLSGNMGPDWKGLRYRAFR